MSQAGKYEIRILVNMHVMELPTATTANRVEDFFLSHEELPVRHRAGTLPVANHVSLDDNQSRIAQSPHPAVLAAA